jgi:hypothetical protein
MSGGPGAEALLNKVCAPTIFLKRRIESTICRLADITVQQTPHRLQILLYLLFFLVDFDLMRMDTSFTELQQVTSEEQLSWSTLSSELNWSAFTLEDGTPRITAPQ